MRKSIITLMAVCGVSLGAIAAPPAAFQEGCQYTLLQNMIRDARSHEKVFELIKAGVSMDDKTIRCGGSLLQLAVRRGNPSIVNAILTQDKSRANRIVSLTGFEIPGAPQQIPMLLFTAYYAPSEIIFRVMVDAGADISVRDSFGHDILWYLDKNPVLRQTATEDSIKQTLQNLLLEQGRKELLKKQGTQEIQEKLEAIPDHTPKQLAEPDLSGSTLATPEDDQ